MYTYMLLFCICSHAVDRDTLHCDYIHVGMTCIVHVLRLPITGVPTEYFKKGVHSGLENDVQAVDDISNTSTQLYYLTGITLIS